MIDSSSINLEYGTSSYSPFAQMSYHVPYKVQKGFDMSTWVNSKYPIHVEAMGRTSKISTCHIQIFNQYY